MTQLNIVQPVIGQSDSTEDVKIINAFTAILGVVNGNLDGGNVVASLTGRRLIAQVPFFVQAGTVAASGPYAIAQDGTLIPSSATPTKPLHWWSLDPANYAVVGKTTQWVGRLNLATGVNPSTTVIAQVNAVTFGGSAGGIQWTSGSSANIGSIGSTPGTNVAVVTEGGPQTFPTAGAYIPLIGLSANTAANSAISGSFQIFALNA